MSSGSSLRNRYQAYTNSRASPHKYSNLFMDENYDRLPLCSRDHAVQGAWLPAHPLDKQSWRRANYTWTPLGCRFGKPLDKTCLMKGKKGVDKILFQGDTHLRVAMEELLRRLNGSTTLETNPPCKFNFLLLFEFPQNASEYHELTVSLSFTLFNMYSIDINR